MICVFQLAVGAGVSIRPVVEQAIGQGTAKLLVEQDERKGDLDALAGEPIRVAFAIALNQPVRLHFAEIVAELVQPVARGGDSIGGQDGVMKLPSRPTADRRAAM